jgi:hypothetical protein
VFSAKGKHAAITVSAKCFLLFAITLPTRPKAKATTPNIPNRAQLNPCKVLSIPTNVQYMLMKAAIINKKEPTIGNPAFLDKA